MDIGELLSYKPQNIPKRPQENESDSIDRRYERHRHRKIRRITKSPPPDSPYSSALTNWTAAIQVEDEAKEEVTKEDVGPDVDVPLTEEERDRILSAVETEETQGEIEVLDDSVLKRMILSFEKRSLKNQEMRIKFPDMPDKFMESEVELHEAIQELHVVATTPDLYPVLVELQAVPSMLELLSHENTDISVGIVDLIQELTDVDILNESEEGANALVDALLEQQTCALLVQNLERLDEGVKEESDGVHNTLAIFENLMEFRPELCVESAKQGLMQWILRRLRAKMPFDGNKLYASEMLSILLQNHQENRQTLGEMEGIDVLLQQLAFYKRHDPNSSEEQEMMENLFNCLCSSLMYAPNRDMFLKGEGLQLMNLMLREKKLSRNGSLKVLDHAMSGLDGKENCNKFVDILGLRTIFPLFMKTPKKYKRKGLTIEEHEEHVVSIISSMLHNCKGPQRQRLLQKFTENDHEKVDRLMELHFKYLEKVEEVDLKIDNEQKESEDDDEDSSYLRRLEGGLFTLQLVDFIIIEVCSSGPSTIKQRVQQILNLRGGSLKTIRHIMREYAGNLGDEGDQDWRDQEQQHILHLVDKF